MEPAKPKGPVRSVTCYHCGHGFDIAARSMSSSCPKCSKPLKVEDVVVKTAHFVRKLQTCGRIVVEPKGKLNAALIQAQLGIEVRGSVEGNVTSGGPVVLGAKARWKGDCRAPSLTVEEGARIDAGYFVVPYNGTEAPEDAAETAAEREPPEIVVRKIEPPAAAAGGSGTRKKAATAPNVISDPPRAKPPKKLTKQTKKKRPSR